MPSAPLVLGIAILFGIALGSQLPTTAPAAEPAAADFATFTRDESPLIRRQLQVSDREYRQIEPTLWHLAQRYHGTLVGLPASQRLDRLVGLADFIERLRDTHADEIVIGEGQRLLGLLDPDRGLDPKEVTTIAAAYGARATVWKQGAGGPTGPATNADTAEGFLAAVRAAAADTTPTTIVVLGHGLPTEIQSYSIPCETLAAAFLDGVAGNAGAGDGDAGTQPPERAARPVDLGHLALVCDDCFSADFLENLGAALEEQCQERALDLVALPTCIAGTNRDRYGIADVGEKFVPHFWKDVIELYYVRRPLPNAVVLADFFESVDNMMYGYGRTPVVEGGKVVTYRLVNPDLVQDPVVFVSLDDAELVRLRTILGLPPDAPLPRLFDIG